MSYQFAPPGEYRCVVAIEHATNFVGCVKEEFTATYFASDGTTVFFDMPGGTRKVFNLQKVLWYTVTPIKISEAAK